MNKLFFFQQVAEQTICFPLFAEQSFFHKKNIAPPPEIKWWAPKDHTFKEDQCFTKVCFYMSAERNCPQFLLLTMFQSTEAKMKTRLTFP